MLPSLPRVYLLLGFAAGYALVMLFNPVRQALRDGFRCLGRFKRIWVTFLVLGLAYTVFQFLTFSPAQTAADFNFDQLASVVNWQWPRLSDVWLEAPLPALENVAGLFDNATTTYPLSVVAAILLLSNWRGLHGALLRALRQRYGALGLLIYLVLLVSGFATLIKPILFWRLPDWAGLVPAAGLLRISASVDAVAFIFEYLFGVYIQVYLITVCFVWIRGLGFEEGELFRFAVRRFSYVLKWAGLVVVISTLFVRVPLLLAYFMNIPNVLDYLPFQRIVMCFLIIAFASVQVSLSLHNENLRAAIRAHGQFLRRNYRRFGWFLLVCGFHFFFIMACDAVVRGAIADRAAALILWKIIFVCLRAFITGWLLASWVCLFRQCETGRLSQESWIRY
jgi:hypothetical protein